VDAARIGWSTLILASYRFFRPALGRMVLWLSLTCAILLVAPCSALAQTYDAGLRAYRNGDVAKAFQIWSPLAEEGHAQAQYGIAVLYEAGSAAVPKDDVKAAQWYRKAADAGIVAAQNNLALMYAQGRGVPRDVNMAAQWWQLAAKSGHAMAQYNLGLAYYRGEGVQRSYPEAIDWFRKAAAQGVRDAQYALGQMYLLGISVPKDDGRALGWYQLAAAQGHPQAKQQVDTLTKAGVKAINPGDVPVAPAQTGGTKAGVPSQTMQRSVGKPVKLTPDAPSGGEASPAPGTGGAVQQSGNQASVVTQQQAPAQAAALQAAQTATGQPKVVYQDTPQPKSQQPTRPTQSTGTAGTGSAAPAAVQQAAVQPTTGGTYRVWLGSGSDEAEASTLWGQLRARHGTVLAPMQHWVVPAQGGFYRILAGPLATADDARRLCNSLRAGDPLTFCKPYQ
jgi:TPR repeat protein